MSRIRVTQPDPGSFGSAGLMDLPAPERISPRGIRVIPTADQRIVVGWEVIS
ncbi:hypothetical protein [Haloferula chungangensis]|uniref:hypothetical protein n=1 Tax=Haloferula chungangensis TaxID=1048331 RepID=UPI0036D33A76